MSLYYKKEKRRRGKEECSYRQNLKDVQALFLTSLEFLRLKPRSNISLETTDIPVTVYIIFKKQDKISSAKLYIINKV